MVCEQCGCELDETMKFCPGCGAGTGLVKQETKVMAVPKESVSIRETPVFKAVAQANVAAMDYKEAQKWAAYAHAEYVDERRALRNMFIAQFIVLAVLACLVNSGGGDIFILFNEGWTDFMQHGSVVELIMNILVGILVMAFMGSIGWGIVGLWRWLKRRDWFILGNVVFMLLLFEIFFMVAAIAGIPFMIFQLHKVRKARTAAEKTDERLAEATAAIS